MGAPSEDILGAGSFSDDELQSQLMVCDMDVFGLLNWGGLWFVLLGLYFHLFS